MVQNFKVDEGGWICCPTCSGRTRTKIRSETYVRNFPIYCPRCKQEYLIDAEQLRINLSGKPDAETQSC